MLFYMGVVLRGQVTVRWSKSGRVRETQRELLHVSGTVENSEMRRSRIWLVDISRARSRTRPPCLNTALERRESHISTARASEGSNTVAIASRIHSPPRPGTLALADPPGAHASSICKFWLGVSHSSAQGTTSGRECAGEAGLGAKTLRKLPEHIPALTSLKWSDPDHP